MLFGAHGRQMKHHDLLAAKWSVVISVMDLDDHQGHRWSTPLNKDPS